ncbi:MAG: ribonuclease HII [Ruminococcaceae bacterium]|nr:ribonuclease HII [Oscillospiraceae bacterium]
MNFDLEHEYTSKGYTVIAGTDEAGRGPLCGPVCAAAVILDPSIEIPGLNDSKKLTEKKREALYPLILEKAISYGIAFASVEEIDELNILNASQLAMRRAVAMLTPTPDLVLVDGNVARDFPMNTVKVIKGDAISPSIAAASILAKVTRDRLCMELDKEYPQYGIAAHKGYPTKVHMDAVREHGPSPIHRKTFLKFLNK